MITKKIALSVMSVACSFGIAAAATPVQAQASTMQATENQNMTVQGVALQVIDSKTGKLLNQNQWGYYGSPTGSIVICEGSPDFGAVVGRYYTNAGITNMTQGSHSGVNYVKVWVDSSKEQYSSSSTIPGYTFSSDYLEDL
ncbi:hypothetical protein SK066_05345 [Paenibacillus hunanensis]|uniref:hypothetical protein n=1 Tax=Paenibacillus hunanensis TaxID=539262 RepID=UPI002A6B80AC|nr:hypothetical protein [Paenibacillus hunanensis]WPP42380.1 hypothetical protein SK066_05345 [Paenibacillus hunanensis]